MFMLTATHTFVPIRRKYTFRKICIQQLTPEHVKQAQEQVKEICENEGDVFCKIATEYAKEVNQQYEKLKISQCDLTHTN